MKNNMTVEQHKQKLLKNYSKFSLEELIEDHKHAIDAFFNKAKVGMCQDELTKSGTRVGVLRQLIRTKKGEKEYGFTKITLQEMSLKQLKEMRPTILKDFNSLKQERDKWEKQLAKVLNRKYKVVGGLNDIRLPLRLTYNSLLKAQNQLEYIEHKLKEGEEKC